MACCLIRYGIIGDLQRIGGRVLVPTKIFKAIYLPSLNQAAAYITDNAPGNNYSVISIAQLEKLTGINIFPKMSQVSKQQILSLPVVKGDAQVPFQDNGVSQPVQNASVSNGFFDKLERKIHNFNKGY